MRCSPKSTGNDVPCTNVFVQRENETLNDNSTVVYCFRRFCFVFLFFMQTMAARSKLVINSEMLPRRMRRSFSRWNPVTCRLISRESTLAECAKKWRNNGDVLEEEETTNERTNSVRISARANFLRVEIFRFSFRSFLWQGERCNNKKKKEEEEKGQSSLWTGEKRDLNRRHTSFWNSNETNARLTRKRSLSRTW